MQVEWYGQSAFRLTDGATTVFIDPFDDMTSLPGRGMRWDYPATADVRADLLLVTHEHLDHNGVGAIAGDPVILRSTAGRLESPVGEVLAVASEHDDAAGIELGPNTLFAFTLGGRRVAHLGDLGQGALREAQARALGSVDLLFVPIGGGPTIGAGAGRRDRRAGGRPHRRADALPDAAHRLPRARRRGRAGRRARRAPGVECVRPRRPPGRRRPARRRARRALTSCRPPADRRRESPIENRPARAAPLQSVHRSGAQHAEGQLEAAIVVCLMVGLVGTSPAQASDAGLRKIVKRHEGRVVPLAKFSEADKALATAPDTSAASAADQALRVGLRRFKNAVVPIKTQTSTAALAKKKLLKALREFDLGLIQYQTLLDKVNGGESKDSLKQSFVTLNKRIAAAAKNEGAALRLLGFRGS